MQNHGKSCKIMYIRQHLKKEKLQIPPYPNVSEKNLTTQKVSSSSKEKKNRKKISDFFFDLEFPPPQKKLSMGTVHCLCEQYIVYVDSTFFNYAFFRK